MSRMYCNKAQFLAVQKQVKTPYKRHRARNLRTFPLNSLERAEAVLNAPLILGLESSVLFFRRFDTRVHDAGKIFNQRVLKRGFTQTDSPVALYVQGRRNGRSWVGTPAGTSSASKIADEAFPCGKVRQKK